MSSDQGMPTTLLNLRRKSKGERKSTNKLKNDGTT